MQPSIKRDQIQKWYNNRRWVRRSLHQLDQHPLCCMCLEDKVVCAATIADHVVPHHGNYELFWYGRLQSLCKPHHDSTKRQIENKGYYDDIGTDGWPTDPRHPANKV